MHNRRDIRGNTHKKVVLNVEAKTSMINKLTMTECHLYSWGLLPAGYISDSEETA